jgi:hypothetical protein
MPSLDQHQSAMTTKMLLLGDSGAGKTGAICALADAGYNVRIIDLDNGLDILRNYLMSTTGPYKPDAWKNVLFKTLTEPPVKLSSSGGQVRQATVWQRFVETLNDWKETDPVTKSVTSLGGVGKWTPQDVLVIDSLSFLGKACFNHAAFQNAGSKDGRMAYFHAQNYVEHALECLYSDDVKCNVIITAHILYVGDELQIQHGYPVSIGKALSPKIGRFFNSMLMIKSVGKSRKIFTNPQGQVELKNAAPLRVKAEYDITHGLAEYFRDVQGPRPEPATIADRVVALQTTRS